MVLSSPVQLAKTFILSKLRLGVLISGRGSNLKAILTAIAADKLSAKICMVSSSNPQATGLEHAKKATIPYFGISPTSFESKKAYEAHLVTLFQSHGAEWIVLAGYMHVLGETFLEAYPKKIINIHPSLLPAFKGLHAQKQALDYGVKLSGCTTHFVDKSLDGGPIIQQLPVSVLEHDTVETLSKRILKKEHRLLISTLNDIQKEYEHEKKSLN